MTKLMQFSSTVWADPHKISAVCLGYWMTDNAVDIIVEGHKLMIFTDPNDQIVYLKIKDVQKEINDVLQSKKL